MDDHLRSAPRLLVVDDDKDVRAVLQEALSEEGYQVDVGASLDEALDQIDHNLYHLILADLLLRPSDAPLDSVQIINAHAHPTPVAAVTAWNISASEILAAGLARLIPKPFDLNELLETVAVSVANPLNPEQQRQAQMIRQFADAVNAKDVTASLATCTDGVRVYHSGRAPASPVAQITGQAAYRVYLEHGLSALRVEDYLIFPQPGALGIRYLKSWSSADAKDGRARQTGSALAQFSGDRISQITVNPDSLAPRVSEQLV